MPLLLTILMIETAEGLKIVRERHRRNRKPVGSRSESARKTRGTIKKAAKGRAIIMGVRNLNTGAKRRTKRGLLLEQSAKEILAHVKGDARLPMRRIVLPDEVDVKRTCQQWALYDQVTLRGLCWISKR